MDASQITKLLQMQNTRYINRSAAVDSSTMIWRNQIQSSKYIKGVKTCSGDQNTDAPTEATCSNGDGTCSYGGGGKQMTLATGSTQHYPSVFRGAEGSASQVYSSDKILLQKAGRNYCTELITEQDAYIVQPACYASNSNGPTNSNPNPAVNNQGTNPFLPPFDTYYKFKNLAAPCKDQNQKHYVQVCNGKAQTIPSEAPHSPWPAFMVGENTESYIIANSIVYYGDAVYIVGTYAGTVDFYSGGLASAPNPVVTLVTPSIRIMDGFIAKYGREGDVQWVAPIKTRTISSDHITQAYSVVADEGGITVSGYFRDTIEFYNGYYNGITTGTLNYAQGTGQSLTSDYGIFLARYNHGGTLNWLNFLDNVYQASDNIGFQTNYTSTTNICTNGSELYVTTSTQSSSSVLQLYHANNFATPVLSITTMRTQAVLVQYNVTTGAFQWATQMNSTNANAYSYGMSVACDADRVYLGGYFFLTTTFYPTYSSGTIGSEIGTLTKASNPSDGIYILSYNTAGVFQWANQCLNTSPVNNTIIEYPMLQLTVDVNYVYLTALYTQSLGVYFTGGISPSSPQSLTGPTNGNPSSLLNLALISYSMGTGNVSWMGKITNLGTLHLQTGFNLVSDGINVYLTGAFTTGTLSLYSGSTTNPTSVAATLAPLNTNPFGVPSQSASPSVDNLFLVCYSPSGTLRWTAKAGQANSSIAAYGIATGKSRVYVTGWAAGPVDQYQTNGLLEPTVIGKTYTPANTDAYYAMVLAYDTDGNIVP